MIPSNPNAALSGGTGGLAVLLVWLLNTYAGMSFNGAEGAAVAAGVTTVALFVGRRGLLGVLHDLLYGAAKKK